MSDPTRNMLIGFSSIVAALGLAALLFLFGEVDAWIHPRYVVTLNTHEASGIRPGSTVELRGVPIGEVIHLRVTPATQFAVRITVSIDRRVQIPADVLGFVTSPLIGNAAVLQLEEPRRRSEPVVYLPNDGSGTLNLSLRSRIFEEITSAIDERMKPITKSLEDFRALATSLTKLSDSATGLLQPQSESELASGIEPNLRTAVIRMNSAIDTANEALALARDWLADEALRSNVSTSVERAADLMQQASQTIDEYRKLAIALNQRSDEVVKKLLPAADQLALTLEDLHRLSRLAREGEGTVGRLLNQPDLYNNLNDTAIRLQRVLEEVQMLIEKLKTEGVKIGL